jgi:hypothetical protein
MRTAPGPTPLEPVLYVIWYRAGSGRRWKKVGRTATHAEAVTLCGHRGDWHIAPLYDQQFEAEPKAARPDADGPSLFDDEEPSGQRAG